MQILVIEENEQLLEQMTAALSTRGYETVGFTSGKKGVEYLEREGSVDALVSDMHLPDLDGFQLLKLVRMQRRFKRVPVIVCTTHQDRPTIMKTLSMGANDMIVKPVDCELLISKVAKALERIPGAVLVVDDEPMLRNLLDKLLKRAGFRVCLAESGEKALSLLENEKVRVLLTDLKMPGMTGLELITAARKKLPELPAILMTGYSGTFGPAEASAAGADDYISKPFKNTEILSKLHTYFD